MPSNPSKPPDGISARRPIATKGPRLAIAAIAGATATTTMIGAFRNEIESAGSYSYLSASMGSKFVAILAGWKLMKTPTAPEKRKAMATIAGLISVRVRNNVRLEVVLEELFDAKSARSSLNPDRLIAYARFPRHGGGPASSEPSFVASSVVTDL